MNLDFLPRFTPYLGVDLGTDRTRIWLQGQGLVINQPSAIAINQRTGQVVAVGNDAAEMMGRVQAQIQVFWPIKQAKLHDLDLAKSLLQVWLQQVLGWRYLLSPVVMVSVAASSTQANRQAVTELFYQLGAREVYTIAQPLSAAIGAGVPIADASGTLICQLGAGIVEAGLISLGSLTDQVASDKAGKFLEKTLQQYIQDEYQLLVSRETTRGIIKKLLLVRGSDQKMMVVGKTVLDHSPVEMELSAAKLAEPTQQILLKWRNLIQTLLSAGPPELAGDVLDKGMLLSGGLARLSELDAWLTKELGIAVSVVEEPDLVVINGMGVALDHLPEFRQSISYE